VDPELVKSVIQAESAYNPNAVSNKGAIGLMQLMPGTAQRFGVKQIHDPEQNIHGGVKYLRVLLDLFNNDLSLAVAAYNAGEGAVQRFRGIPRYTETQNYVQRVLTLYGKPQYSQQKKVITAKAVYKYKDSSGNVHFTTKRPTSGEIIEIKL
jgi:soluble lytic murein transglycosylase-like protein